MITLESLLQSFDPNGAAAHEEALFGLPHGVEFASVVALPVVWDGTASYHKGSAKGPQAILEGSLQVDLTDPILPDAWQHGIAYAPALKPTESGIDQSTQLSLAQVNQISAELEDQVRQQSRHWLNSGKLVAIVGGEHSVPLGLIKELAQRHAGLGILQIDAHLDLRKDFEGYSHSHASIMHNALEKTEVASLVSVGIRDYCDAEEQYVQANRNRIHVFYDHVAKRQLFEGVTWASICRDVISRLPQEVYISFDIDGLSPSLCPNTGTPVPGGLTFEQTAYLIREVALAGKQIVGFDLCEVAPDPHGQSDWDGNVGARVLWMLSNAAIRSQQ